MAVLRVVEFSTRARPIPVRMHPEEEGSRMSPTVHASPSPEYARATRPLNTVTDQTPALVAVPHSAAEVADVVRLAASRGLRVVPQATGHGAGAAVGADTMLLDTSALRSVVVDPATRTATVGSGATWSDVNRAAQEHGLLGLAGTAPTVSVSGYTFGGGIGWLARRDGLASGSLRRVGFVDGSGRPRVASDESLESLDRDALWSFRGAGGVGVATELELDLFPTPALHAGTLLWPVDALDAVVDAWADSLRTVGPSVTSSIAVLHVPPAPAFPESLRGRVAVLLAVADPDGARGAEGLITAVRAAAPPVADDWGPSDAQRLARIHLDPPDAAPAVGDARWLDAGTTDVAATLLRTVAADDSPVVMMELRHVGGAPTKAAGALTTAASPFIYHAVGLLGRASRSDINATFSTARDVWTPVDAGLTPGSWLDGAGRAHGALPADTLRRARTIADEIDPDHRIARSRLLDED
jgi:FAD/FMN-containing dehydrogenase